MTTEAVKLPQEMVEEVTKASEALGINKQELVGRALLLYLDTIGNYLNLKKEFKDWDALSDEAFLNFEKSLL